LAVFYSERVGKGFLSAELPPDSVLGEGGSERVYKGWVDEKTRAPTRNGTGVAVSRQEAQLGEHAGVRGMTGNQNLAPFFLLYILLIK